MGTPVGLIRWNIREATYRTFDELDGLPKGSIGGMAIDGAGHLWLASSAGVIKYAEGVFTLFNSENSRLPNAAFSKLVVDTLGSVYAGYGIHSEDDIWYDGGVARYDGSTWTYLNIEDTWGGGGPWALCLYHDTLWIGYVQDFYVLVNDSLQSAPGWSAGGVTSFAVDYQDSLWIQSPYHRRTLKYSGGGWNIIFDKDSLGLGDLWGAIWPDPRGGLWLSGYRPYRLDIEYLRQGIQCNPNLPAGICDVPGIPGDFKAHYALNDTTQFFVRGEGLFGYNGSEWSTYAVPKTIYSNHIDALACSPSGVVYIATGSALNTNDGASWDSVWPGSWLNAPIRFHPNGKFWPGDFPTTPIKFIKDRDVDGFQTHWGTYGQALYEFGDRGLGEWSAADMGIATSQGKNPPYFSAVVVDRDEMVWLGATYYGAVRYDQSHWHPIPSSDSTLPSTGNEFLFADSKGRVWFAQPYTGSFRGFTIYDGLNWESYHSEENPGSTYILAAAEDHDNNIWLGTGGGLIKYDGTSWVLFDSENSGLPTDAVHAVTVDRNGNVWIGTELGLYIYHPSVPVVLAPPDGSSPVDSLSISEVDGHARVAFTPRPRYGTQVKYQLERARGVHKFWPVGETDYSSAFPDRFNLVDTSAIIGYYFYRIKEVSQDGKVRYSRIRTFSGGNAVAVLKEFQAFPVGNRMYFQWTTKQEAFVKSFEIERIDPTTYVPVLVASLPIEIPNSLGRAYELCGDSLIHSNIPITYTLRVVYENYSSMYLSTVTVDDYYPTQFEVSENYPNPFNNSTTLNLKLPFPSQVVLRLYNAMGEMVVPVRSKYYSEGYHQLSVDLSILPSAIYFYRIEASGKVFNGKLLLVK